MESIALKAYNSRQSRYPKGHPMGGQWKPSGATPRGEKLYHNLWASINSGKLSRREESDAASELKRLEREKAEHISRTIPARLKKGPIYVYRTKGQTGLGSDYKGGFHTSIERKMAEGYAKKHNLPIQRIKIPKGTKLWNEFRFGAAPAIARLVARGFGGILRPHLGEIVLFITQSVTGSDFLRLKAYNPRQARWPKGTSMGGQWRSKISGRLLDRGTLTAGRTRFADNVTIRGGLFAGKETAAVKSVVRSIGGIHKVGVIPRLTIQTSGNLSSPFFGAYFIGRNRIVVAASGSHPHMTAAHEIGHFLDHKGFDKAWASANSAKLAGWRKAVESSAAIKHLREMEKGGFLRNGRFKMPVSKSVTNYYLAPREIWARSYAQYIARRSGNRSMIRELRFLQNNRLRTQWDDRDFDPIAQELDKLFRSEGWL